MTFVFIDTLKHLLSLSQNDENPFPSIAWLVHHFKEESLQSKIQKMSTNPTNEASNTDDMKIDPARAKSLSSAFQVISERVTKVSAGRNVSGLTPTLVSPRKFVISVMIHHACKDHTIGSSYQLALNILGYTKADTDGWLGQISGSLKAEASFWCPGFTSRDGSCALRRELCAGVDREGGEVAKRDPMALYRGSTEQYVLLHLYSSFGIINPPTSFYCENSEITWLV